MKTLFAILLISIAAVSCTKSGESKAKEELNRVHFRIVNEENGVATVVDVQEIKL